MGRASDGPETPCPDCGDEGPHESIDPLLPDPHNVAYACAGCDIIFKA